MALGSLRRKALLDLGGNGGRLGLGLVRGLKTVALPDLPYEYGSLEPAISAEIMLLHQQKHHQAYVSNYNKALGQLDDAIDKGDVSTVVKLQSAIKFNGGVACSGQRIEANQDPLVTKGATLVPLLGIDVWEHAYYLQYKNVKPDYLNNIWKVMNWKYASEVFEKESP